MLEGDGEEVYFDDADGAGAGDAFGHGGSEDGFARGSGEDSHADREESLEIMEDGTQLEPTQRPRGAKVFRPLFED